MSVKSVVLTCLCLSLFAFADPSGDISALENNQTTSSSIEKAQRLEIDALKSRVSELEKELRYYKKVTPVASKVKRGARVEKKQERERGKRFSLLSEVPQTLPVYYEADPQSVSEVTFHLEQNGFTVLSSDEILKGKTVISFTNDVLKQTSSFLSVLHLLVNQEKEIRVQNPSYFAAAFLEGKYKYGDMNTTLEALDKALDGIYEVKAHYRLADLPEYHFMFGMPRFKDTILVAKGDDLVSKLKENNARQYIAYLLELPNGAVLVGHKLKPGTYTYLQKIKAENNAQIFPYPVMIKDNRAFMLAPKYYLALSLPYLSMTDFLKIASAPEMIAKDIKAVYK